MASQQPLIKIIPPNPVTHSILIAYCYCNNKTIQCQAKWTRVQSSLQNLQSRNSRSLINMQTGNTYKCTPLDFNHTIEVEAVCEYQGKQFKLTARTELVKASKELFDKKSKQKTVNCKISNSNFEIQCSIGTEFDRILQLNCGSRQFNMQILTSHIITSSNSSFKCRIHSHRYEFLTFFHDCTNQRHKTNSQLSLTNLFEFNFSSEIDKDLVLLKVAENSTVNFEKGGGFSVSQKPIMITSQQQLPSHVMEGFHFGAINVQLKNGQSHEMGDEKSMRTKRSNFDALKIQNIPKDGAFGLKNLDPKLTNPTFHSHFINTQTPQHESKQSNSAAKKNQKIKISQKIIKKSQKQTIHAKNSKSHNDIKIKQQILIINEPSIGTSNQKKKTQKVGKQFLNIFDDDESAVSQPDIILQSSSPQFYGQNTLKPRPITNYNQNTYVKTEGKNDLPSINLRGSFEQLQKVGEPSSNKKTKQKVKTQTSRQLSYQYPKARQKTQTFVKTPPNETTQTLGEDKLKRQITQMKKQNEQLKKQNAELKKQLDTMNSMSKENVFLKKKYYQMAEEISKIELERKEILADKLKCESNYHKEKQQKETLKKQLQQLIRLLQKTPPSSQYLLSGNLSKQRLQTEHYPSSAINDPTQDQKTRQNPTNPISSKTLTINNIKRNYVVPQSRDRTPQSKTPSHNHSLLIEESGKWFESHTHSRKQLKFPSFSYKYNTLNPNILRP